MYQSIVYLAFVLIIILGTSLSTPIRLLHADIDLLYDSDDSQYETNVNMFVERIQEMGVNTVFLQAYANPDASVSITQLYFDSDGIMGVRKSGAFKDLTDKIRALGVKVYAWMPGLQFDIPDSEFITHYNNGSPEIDPSWYLRLSPFNQTNRDKVKSIFRSLAQSVDFDGILFHDDLVLSEGEDVSPSALSVYQQEGFGSTWPEIESSDRYDEFILWRSEYLNLYTQELIDVIHEYQPEVKTTRSLYSSIITNPTSEQWLGQNLQGFGNRYDFIAPMVMPYMESIAKDEQTSWFLQIISALKDANVVDKVIAELQAKNWVDSSAINAEELAGWMTLLKNNGVQHFGYYPDNVFDDIPTLNVIAPVLQVKEDVQTSKASINTTLTYILSLIIV